MDQATVQAIQATHEAAIKTLLAETEASMGEPFANLVRHCANMMTVAHCVGNLAREAGVEHPLAMMLHVDVSTCGNVLMTMAMEYAKAAGLKPDDVAAACKVADKLHDIVAKANEEMEKFESAESASSAAGVGNETRH